MVNFTDEKHLLIDLKDGSFQAFERLYNMYSGKLYNFIMRLSSGNQYTDKSGAIHFYPYMGST